MRSMIENCKLVEAFTGRMIVRLTRDEGESMVDQKTARRSGSHKYTLVSNPHPSNSGETPPALDKFDMSIVAGGTAPTECEFERLAGWGFRVSRPRAEVQLA